MVRTLKIAVVSAFCVIGALSSSPASANGASAETNVAVENVAMVRLQIRVGDRVFRAPVRAVPWGESATFVIEGAGQRHVVQLRPQAAGGRAHVSMSYERDGTMVASDATREVEPRRATTLFDDDAAAVSVTLIPTRVSISAR
jgi:hypothetical protein